MATALRLTNPALQTLGVGCWKKYIEAIRAFSDHPNVSVGSGIGAHEYIMMKTVEGLRVVCVDPDATSYSGKGEKVWTEPEFKYVKDLLEARPEYKNVAPLILDWTTPDFDSYDLKAIALLNPPVVAMVLDTSGAAGSSGLLTWLEDVPGMERFLPSGLNDFSCVIQHEVEGLDYDSLKYRVLKSTHKVVPRPLGAAIYRYVLLVRTDLGKDDIEKIESVLSDVPN